MRADRIIQLIAALVLIASLTGAGALMTPINASASYAQLRYTDEATEGAPLPVVVAQSVGVLRGIVVNYLWIRAERLKEEGKFFEAYHIAKWVTDLQPRFASVWSFQAWNMAYNISVATHTREERWHWVQAGVRLLREKGIKYNPNDMGLYKELSWIFFHKIGGYTDDAHNFYKQQMADRWQGILGPPPYEQEERLEWLREMAAAPKYQADLEAANPGVIPLIEEVQSAGFELDESLLRVWEQLRSAETSYLGQKLDLVKNLDELARSDELDAAAKERIRPLVRLRELRDDPRYADVWPALLAFTRKQVLLNEYNMDPEYMALFTERFGPLDWRSPATHSVYWAALGVERGLTRFEQEGFDQINTDRMLFHSLQDLKRKGRVYYDFITKEQSFGPDLRFIPYYLDVADLVMTRNPFQDRGGRNLTYEDGMRNFLIDAVREYYSAGQMEEATDIYIKLGREFVQEGRPDRFDYPLSEFVLRETYERFDSPDVARPTIFGYLLSAYVNGLARGDRKAYEANLNTAGQIYENFVRQYADYYGQLDRVEQRIVLPPWDDLRTLAFEQAMTDEGVTIPERVALWNTPAVSELKLRTYDRVVPQLRGSVARRYGDAVVFDELFPPPPGLDEWRARNAPVEPDEPELQIERK